MNLADGLLQIGFPPLVRIYSLIVSHRVRTADTSLLLLLPNRMNRHQPDNRHAEIFQTVELGRDAFKVSRGGEVSLIDFIDHAIAHPFAGRSGILSGEIARRSLSKRSSVQKTESQAQRRQISKTRAMMC